jgi:hypothetical protein
MKHDVYEKINNCGKFLNKLYVVNALWSWCRRVLNIHEAPCAQAGAHRIYSSTFLAGPAFILRRKHNRPIPAGHTAQKYGNIIIIAHHRVC